MFILLEINKISRVCYATTNDAATNDAITTDAITKECYNEQRYVE
jgi:hypothetical protein